MQTSIEVERFANEKVVRPVFFDESQRRNVVFPMPESPQARNFGELISAKQLQIVDKLSRKSGVDGNKAALELFNFEVGELSKTAAESLIAALQMRVLETVQPRQIRMTG